MSIHKTEAIVLNTYDFRETSLIAIFFTKDFGKLSGLLKGIRQEPTKFASTLEPFSYNEIVFYKKRNSGLHLVSQCDLKDNFNFVRENISKVGIASIMMELVDNIMPIEDANPDVFELVLLCLKELGTINYPEKIMTIFKIKILALSGFKPNFDCCVCCGTKIFGQTKFSLKLGGLLCPQCSSKDVRARMIFRGTVASILHIQKSDFRNSLNLVINPQIKKELNFILNSFLNFHLEKELKSEKFLRKYEMEALK